jgi:hypothetical protein
VIADVLERARKTLDVTLLPARLPGLAGSSGITEWEGRGLEDDLENTLRIWPHQNDSGGFFVAVLEKRFRTAPSAPGVSRGTVPERSNGSGGAAADDERGSAEVPPCSDMEQGHE